MLLPATKVVGSFFVGALLSKCHSERSEESECGEYGEYREYREYREFREFRELSDSALPSLPILPTLPSLPMTALYIMRLFCLFVFNCQILRLRLRSAQDDKGNGQPKCHSERSEESGSDNGTKRQSLLAGRSFDYAYAPLRMTGWGAPLRMTGWGCSAQDYKEEEAPLRI